METRRSTINHRNLCTKVIRTANQSNLHDNLNDKTIKENKSGLISGPITLLGNVTKVQVKA